MKKFCPNCGKEVEAGIVFCPNCGQQFRKEAAALKPEPQVQQQAQTFCPNCGHAIKQGAMFCNGCGYNLLTKKLPKNPTTPSQVEASPSRVQVKAKKPMSLKQKLLWSTFGVLALLLIGLYCFASQYYSRSNQVDRITSILPSPSQKMGQYVQADTNDFKVSDEAVKPLQKYYQEHQTAVTKMNHTLKTSDEANSYIKLVQSGHYFLLFPKYKLQVKTFQPQVETNHSNSVAKVNGKELGSFSGEDGKYYKKLSLVFPGKYHFDVKSQVEGRDLKASSTVNIWDNKTVNLEIKTQTFNVKSVPGGDVYINDKKVGTLDENGEARFKSYPITRNMELYVVYHDGKKTMQSEAVTDMPTAFGTFDDDYDSSDDGAYNDSASDDSTDDVTKNHGEYTVEPKWKGVISTDDAKDLLGKVFENADDNDDAFIDGASNKDYSDLRQQQKGWDDDDDIDSWDTDVDIEAVYPNSDNSCTVIYRVTYTFNYDDSDKKQVMEFKGAVLQKDGSDEKVKTIGKGKIISSKESSDDDD